MLTINIAEFKKWLEHLMQIEVKGVHAMNLGFVLQEMQRSLIQQTSGDGNGNQI